MALLLFLLQLLSIALRFFCNPTSVFSFPKMNGFFKQDNQAAVPPLCRRKPIIPGCKRVEKLYDDERIPKSTASRKELSLRIDSPLSATCKRVEKPHDTWYFSSNHVLVNRERMMRGIAPLMRNTKLDGFARMVAQGAADRGQATDVDDLREEANDLKVDGTILKGESIKSIHQEVMKTNCKSRDRILKKSFQQFGVATCKRDDGLLVLVQIFSKQGRLEI